MTTPLRAIAYGGGAQSTALLVLAATGRIDYQTFLFANVGDDSEDPATLDYLERYAKPYAAANGIDLHELHRIRRDGTTETLYGRLTKEGSRSLPIPVRMSNGAPGTRSCTVDFKIVVMGRWLKANGASPDNKATVGIGISLDEIARVNNRRAMPYEHPVYPLLDHEPPLRRSDCYANHPGRRPAQAAKERLLVLSHAPAVNVGGNAPGPARPVQPVVRPGGPAQRPAQRARQGPRVPDPLQPAAGRRNPGGSGRAGRNRRPAGRPL